MKKGAVIFNSRFLRCLWLLVFITSGSWAVKAQSKEKEKTRSTDVILRDVKLVRRSETKEKINYFVMLDMKGFELAKKVYITMGRTPEGSDMGNSVGVFSQNGKKVGIKFKGEDFEQCEESIGVLMDIPKAFFPELKNLTVYVEDDKGRISNKIQVQSF